MRLGAPIHHIDALATAKKEKAAEGDYLRQREITTRESHDNLAVIKAVSLGDSPDPCRGWSRNVVAHIRAQREPVVSPAGTGTEYPRPKGPLHGSRGGKASGSPSWPRQGTPIKGMAAGAIRGAMTFSPRRPTAGRRGAHTVAEGDARFGVPRGAGRLPRRQ